MSDAAELIRALAAWAWPALVLAFVLMFKGPIAARLESVRRVKAGPIEAEWERQIAVTEASIDVPVPSAGQPPVQRAPADSSPALSIVGAYAGIEEALRARIRLEDQPDVGGVPMSVTALARVAVDKGVITEETRRAVEGLSVLRNLALHGRQEMTEEQAREYVVLADGVRFAIGVGTTSSTVGSRPLG